MWRTLTRTVFGRTHQEDVDGCLQWIEQMNTIRTGGQCENISFRYHLRNHIFVHHIILAHHLLSVEINFPCCNLRFSRCKGTGEWRDSLLLRIIYSHRKSYSPKTLCQTLRGWSALWLRSLLSLAPSGWSKLLIYSIYPESCLRLRSIPILFPRLPFERWNCCSLSVLVRWVYLFYDWIL